MPKPVQRFTVTTRKGYRFRLYIIVQLLLCVLLGFSANRGRLRALVLPSSWNLDRLRSFCLAAPLLRLRLGTLLRLRRRRRGRPLCSEFVIVALGRPRPWAPPERPPRAPALAAGSLPSWAAARAAPPARPWPAQGSPPAAAAGDSKAVQTSAPRAVFPRKQPPQRWQADHPLPPGPETGPEEALAPGTARGPAG